MKGLKIWTIQNAPNMRNYIEVFVKSYYELTDKGWQIVALYKRIFILKQNSPKSSTLS